MTSPKCVGTSGPDSSMPDRPDPSPPDRVNVITYQTTPECET